MHPWLKTVSALQVCLSRVESAFHNERFDEAMVAIRDLFGDPGGDGMLADDDSPGELVQYGLAPYTAAILAQKGYTIGRILALGPQGMAIDGIRNPERVMAAMDRAKQATAKD